MEIRDSKNINTGNIDTGGGEFRLGDNFYKSIEYNELKERIEELEDLVKSAGDDVAKALKYSKRLEALRVTMQEFKEDVIRLAETFTKIEINTERLKLAKQHFEAGDFKAARAVLDAELMGRELTDLLERKERLASDKAENDSQLVDKANEFLILARLTATDYQESNRFEKTCFYFEQSLSASRMPETLLGYGYFLQEHNKLLKAQPLYIEAVAKFRLLIEKEPIYYSLNLAQALNNLANVYSILNQYNHAIDSFREAIDIRSYLMGEDPDEYSIDLAQTLCNLGNLQTIQNQYNEADQSYKKSLGIIRKLVDTKPELYNEDLAQTLTNIAILQRKQNKYKEAENTYQEALTIRRELVTANSDTSLSNLSYTLNNLGQLLDSQERYSEAEAVSYESVTIRRKLANNNPYIYQPDLANSLNDLAVTYKNIGKFNLAKDAYLEAIEIRKRLAAENQNTYSRDLSHSLANLAVLFVSLNRYNEALENYDEALKYFRHLIEINPDGNSLDFAKLLCNVANLKKNIGNYDGAEEDYKEAIRIMRNLAKQKIESNSLFLAVIALNMSMFYCDIVPRKAESLELAEEFIKHIKIFKGNPNITQKYIDAIRNVLIKWSLDPDNFIKDNG